MARRCGLTMVASRAIAMMRKLGRGPRGGLCASAPITARRQTATFPGRRVGNEGAIGVALFVGGETTTSRAIRAKRWLRVPDDARAAQGGPLAAETRRDHPPTRTHHGAGPAAADVLLRCTERAKRLPVPGCSVSAAGAAASGGRFLS